MVSCSGGSGGNLGIARTSFGTAAFADPASNYTGSPIRTKDSQSGGPGLVYQVGFVLSGGGGNSDYGSGGAGASGAGLPGRGYGSGGAGAAAGVSSAALAGGAGMPGYVIIEEYS